MLGKLIKYDLKFILKTVSIYAVILFCCAILFNITAYDITCKIVDDASVCDEAPLILSILHTIFWNAIFAVIIGLILNGIIRTWARFKLSCFSDEAYLTHTLPIKRNTIWAAKFCSAAITIFIIMIVVAISCIILSFTPSGQNLIASFGIINDASTSYYAIFLLTVFTQLLFMTLCGMTGITIANHRNSNRNLNALIWGFIVYMIGVFIMFGCLLLASNFSEPVHAMFFGAKTPSAAAELFTQDFLQSLLIGVGVIYIVLITALYVIDRNLLEKGVNLD